MDSLQRTPSKTTTNAYLKLHGLLHEIEALIIQLTDFPIGTPGLDLVAQDIAKKIVFFRNFLIAECVSHTPMPEDLVEIQGRIEEQEAEFYNLYPVSVHEDVVSNEGSVCECMNYYGELEGSECDGSSGVHEVDEMLHEYEVMVPPSPEKENGDLTVQVSEPVKVEEWPREETGRRRKRKYWWWRTVVILVPASVVVLVVSYFDKKGREGFLTPT